MSAKFDGRVTVEIGPETTDHLWKCNLTMQSTDAGYT